MLLKTINTPKFDEYLLYTPQYYIDMINLYLNTSIKIILLTDSIDLVQDFILNDNLKKHKNYKNIILLDVNLLSSFYILLNAKEIIMSCSTISMSASYFNENAKCNIVLYHNNKRPEEYAIAPNWNINNNKKYILNYNKSVLLSMVY